MLTRLRAYITRHREFGKADRQLRDDPDFPTIVTQRINDLIANHADDRTTYIPTSCTCRYGTPGVCDFCKSRINNTGTINGMPDADWFAYMADHDAHPPEECNQCYADESLHVPFDPAIPAHSLTPDYDADTCETCWLALK